MTISTASNQWTWAHEGRGDKHRLSQTIINNDCKGTKEGFPYSTANWKAINVRDFTLTSNIAKIKYITDMRVSTYKSILWG